MAKDRNSLWTVAALKASFSRAGEWVRVKCSSQMARSLEAIGLTTEFRGKENAFGLMAGDMRAN